jgi:hypothetical protein
MPSCATATSGASSGDDASDDGHAGGGSPCVPPDSDGVTGGCYVFDVTVDDTGFAPVILKAQNVSQITINLENTGTKAHDFVVGCVPIDYPGCPAQFCFSAKARIASVPPGGSGTATFMTPYVEGIYDFRSDSPADSKTATDGGLTGLWGQFVVQ